MDKLGLVVAVFALAGGGMASAMDAANGTAVATAPDQTDQQIAAWLADDDGSREDAPAALAGREPDDQPRRVHGEASVAFGSNGLRAVGAAADIPIGETSDLGIAASDVSWGRRRGESRSLAVSLRLGPEAFGGGTPCGVHHSVPLLSDALRKDRCEAAAP